MNEKDRVVIMSLMTTGKQVRSQGVSLLTTSDLCLTDGDWEVCLHSLRLLQSVLLEEEVLLPLGSSLLDPDLQARVSQFTSSVKPSLRQAAQQTLEDLQALQQVPPSQQLLNPCCSFKPSQSTEKLFQISL